MKKNEIIETLEYEHKRVTEAIAILRQGPGRPTGRGRRHLSAAARRRISMAQKKRWAAIKKETTD